MSKATLRAKFKAIRQAAHDSANPSVWRRMQQSLWSFEAFSGAKTVMLYCSKESEAPTQDIIQKALDEGKKVCLPITNASERTMELSFISSLDDLVPSSFGVMEPKLSGLISCKPSDVMAALVPGIAFDRDGYRLGWGLGFYDRFLPSLSCPAIGYCYEAQIAEKLPREKFDIPVKAIATENGAKAIIHIKNMQ